MHRNFDTDLLCHFFCRNIGEEEAASGLYGLPHINPSHCSGNALIVNFWGVLRPSQTVLHIFMRTKMPGSCPISVMRLDALGSAKCRQLAHCLWFHNLQFHEGFKDIHSHAHSRYGSITTGYSRIASHGSRQVSCFTQKSDQSNRHSSRVRTREKSTSKSSTAAKGIKIHRK
jgi:hypothetical protein